MLILDKLWNGEPNPSGRRIQNVAYSQCMQEVGRAEENLLSILTAEGKALFDAYDDKSTALLQLREEDAFAEGFRMAVMILLDIFGYTRE